MTNSKQPELYNAIWRWHFYAGLIITPILLVMALTGGIYLFESEIDNAIYGDMLYNRSDSVAPVDHSAIVAAVQRNYPGAKINSYRPPQQAGHNARLVIDTADERELLVLVDPANLSITGEIDSKSRITQISKRIHGGLMAGTTGEVIVELVACWTIIMVIAGLYLWWPRGQGLFGTLLPRLKSHRRIFWRDLHAIPGFLFSLWILVIISTGLPWSVVWGSLLDKFAVSIGEEFPQEVFGNRPQSIAIPGAERLDMNAIVAGAQNQGLKSYEIQYPWGETGTFAVMPLRHGETASHTTYLFIDQFSGEIRKDIRWADIGAVGQAVSLGVRLHEGRLFGRTNQFMNLTAVLVLIGISLTGFIMWLQRKPRGSLGAPRVLPSFQIEKSIVLTIIILGIVLPLAGLSMLLFWLFERIRLRRVSP